MCTALIARQVDGRGYADPMVGFDVRSDSDPDRLLGCTCHFLCIAYATKAIVQGTLTHSLSRYDAPGATTATAGRIPRAHGRWISSTPTKSAFLPPPIPGFGSTGESFASATRQARTPLSSA